MKNRPTILAAVSGAFLALGLVAFTFTACSRSTDTGTGPTPVTAEAATSVPSASTSPAPATSPTPTPDPGHPEVVYVDGKFTILNPTGHDVIYRMCFFQMSDPFTYQNQGYLEQSVNVTAPKQTDTTVIPMPDLKIACGQTVTVQADPWKGGGNCPRDPGSIDERGTPNMTFKGPDCKCDDYEKPTVTVTGSLSLGTKTATTVIVNGTFSPAGGTATPTVPATVPLPDYGSTLNFSVNYAGSVAYGPENLKCSVPYSKQFTIAIPPKDPTCRDFPVVPVVFGTPVTPQTATTFTLSGFSFITPPGGVAVPTLPTTVGKPPVGSGPGNIHVSYSADYHPIESLTCPTSGSTDVPVPPQTDPCAQTAPPVVTLTCDPNPFFNESVDCTANSSVSSTFVWGITEYQTQCEPSCSTTSKMTYSKHDLDSKNWRVTVTATACDQCKKTGTATVDLNNEVPDLCHTENIKYCRDDGTDCQVHRPLFFHPLKKWQCQNVPPGTPGHYPNHFDHSPQHDDFWGACTTQKCYNITN